jgi:hypothetical protein
MNAAEWFAVDGMPPERNTGFLIIKHLMISE